MNYKSKFFDELNTRELYAILKARVDVFVVEQKCAYPELDGIDYKSLHVYNDADGEIARQLFENG